MKSHLISSIFVFTLFGLVYKSEGDDQCKAAVKVMLTDQLSGLTACIKKLNYADSKEVAAKMPCVLKCVLQTGGIIGDDGFLDPVEALKFVEKSLPQNVIEKATMLMMHCQDAAANVNPAEENCQSYSAVIRCAMNAINKFCI